MHQVAYIFYFFFSRVDTPGTLLAEGSDPRHPEGDGVGEFIQNLTNNCLDEPSDGSINCEWWLILSPLLPPPSFYLLSPFPSPPLHMKWESGDVTPVFVVENKMQVWTFLCILVTFFVSLL
jgi:hypothetical protein